MRHRPFAVAALAMACLFSLSADVFAQLVNIQIGAGHHRQRILAPFTPSAATVLETYAPPVAALRAAAVPQDSCNASLPDVPLKLVAPAASAAYPPVTVVHETAAPSYVAYARAAVAVLHASAPPLFAIPVGHVQREIDRRFLGARRIVRPPRAALVVRQRLIRR